MIPGIAECVDIRLWRTGCDTALRVGQTRENAEGSECQHCGVYKFSCHVISLSRIARDSNKAEMCRTSINGLREISFSYLKETL